MRGTKHLYDSYRMYHTDGETLMCSTNKEKALWYVSRGLAEWIDEDQTAYRLLFEPNGYGKHGDNYYLQSFKNQCVCCGSEKFLTKHHVVPSAFRRYFSPTYKSHSFHDVLLVCHDCHETYEREGDNYRDFLCVHYLGKPYKEIIADFNRAYHPQCASRTLARYGNLIPPHRKEYLEKLASAETTYLSKKIDWSKEIVSKLDTPEKLYSFVVSWRQHFVDTMKPKFMPENWSVDRKLDITDDRRLR